MIKVSELIGKPLVALACAERIGTVGNVLFDQRLRTAQYLKIYCDDETQPEFQFVAFRRVLHLDADACIVTDKDAVTFAWNTPFNGTESPINCACYNQSGKYYGTVRDIQLDGAQVSGIEIGEKTIRPDQILSSSPSLMILNDTGKPIKLVRKKTSVPKQGGNTTAKIHAQTDAEKSADAVSRPSRVPPQSTLVSRTPQKPDTSDVAAYAFLLGKKLSRDLKSDDGKTLAHESSPVTEDIIRTAKSAGKLVQLALYAD